jgi:hypothetical protein
MHYDYYQTHPGIFEQSYSLASWVQAQIPYGVIINDDIPINRRPKKIKYFIYLLLFIV